MEDNTNITQTEDNNTQQVEKTFTQEEVNRIIQERLSRERSVRTPEVDSLAQRELELTKKENRILCAQKLMEKGHSSELLDILDTGDTVKFEAAIETLERIYPSADTKRPQFVRGTAGTYRPDKNDQEIRGAFGLGEAGKKEKRKWLLNL